MKENQNNNTAENTSKENGIRKRFVTIMDIYHNEDREKGMIMAIQEMTPFIHFIIKKKFSQYQKHYEDLVQQGTIGIIVGMEKYNPAISAPSTFFTYYIVHEMSRYIDTYAKKTTPYYAQQIAAISKAKEKFESAGVKYNEVDLASETGINIDTIHRCLNLINATNEMYIESEEFIDAQLSTKALSPEEEYLKKEEAEIVHKAVMSLDVLGYKATVAKFGLEGTPFPSGQNVTDKEIANKYGVSLDNVKKARHIAARKLRKMPELRALFYDHYSDSEECLLEEKQISLVPVSTANKMLDQLEGIEIDF